MNRLELKALYQERLHPRILDLEGLRYRTLFFGGMVAVCLLGFVIDSAILEKVSKPNRIYPFVLAFLLMAGFVFCVYKAYQLSQRYRRLFKAGVVKELVRVVDSSYEYHPEKGIDRDNYDHSQLFLRKPNRYQTDDLIQGQIGSAEFQMAEVHSRYQSGQGKKRREKTIFHGLFFSAAFPKALRHDTFVLPDRAQKIFGSVLGHLFQGHNPTRENLVKLENPDFEKYFVVYGDDQVEARYILTPKMMERLLDFKKRVGRPVYLSFRGSLVYLAVPTGPLFEPSFQRPSTYRDMVKMVETISLATEIVTQLELSTQLWKEAS